MVSHRHFSKRVMGAFWRTQACLHYCSVVRKKVIWVASAYRGLNPDYDFTAATVEGFDPDKAGVVEELYDKFGYGYATESLYYSHNQVFKKESLLPVVKTIAACKSKGKPAVLRVTLDVMQNTWWGIEGGRSLEVLIIYLEKVADFEDSLPSDTQHELAKGWRGSLPDYPIYETGLGKLTACQVNLLAAQGEYCVRESNGDFMDFCN